jgi:hypothetical protein
MSEEESKNVISVKTEHIADDDDVDCFGNFDSHEVNTCMKCGLRGECAVATQSIRDKRDFAFTSISASVESAKSRIQSSQDVVELVRSVKSKQTEMETNIMEKVKKLKPKGSEASSGSSEKKSEKRSRSRVPVETIGDTTIPVAFKALYKGLKELGDLRSKKSITNVLADKGILVCIPIPGRTPTRLQLFLNHSRGYKMESGKSVEVKSAKKGEVLLVVSAEDKSIQEALSRLAKWKKDRLSLLGGAKEGSAEKKKPSSASANGEAHKNGESSKRLKKKKKRAAEPGTVAVKSSDKPVRIRPVEEKSKAPIAAKPAQLEIGVDEEG